jgi:hypothetical protein
MITLKGLGAMGPRVLFLEDAGCGGARASKGGETTEKDEKNEREKRDEAQARVVGHAGCHKTWFAVQPT